MLRLLPKVASTCNVSLSLSYYKRYNSRSLMGHIASDVVALHTTEHLLRSAG